MTNDSLLRLIETRIAIVAIGANTLRNQGARNVVSNTRGFLRQLDLKQFTGLSASGFRKSLDTQTKKLQKVLPVKARNWGTARKALNIFLRDVLYTRYLCKEYGFDRLEPWLEVPLDRDIARNLREEPEGKDLARWQGVERLERKKSVSYQLTAEKIAKRFQIARVHLDLIYWRRDSGLGAYTLS